MKYITIEEFVASVGMQTIIELTDEKKEINMELLNAINEASVAEVEGCLRGVYCLPLSTPTPSLIKGIVSDIMIFKLNQRRNPKNISESLVTLYKLAMSKLEKIQQRKILIDAKGVGKDPSVSAGQIASWTPKQTFANHFTKMFEE